ncbi:MAG: glycoside hydrolase family 172 protein [Vicinamibacterales bacterium]
MRAADARVLAAATAAAVSLLIHDGVAQEPAPVGLAALAAFDRYPVLTDDAQMLYLSSYDRTGGNDDGFDGTYSALSVDSRGEHVIFDARGPGCVYTLWFTSRVDGWSGLDWGRLRLYFDDEAMPRVDVDANELFAGATPPFVAPFVYGPFTSTGGHLLQMPLPFARRLRITTERRAGFYNLSYQLFAADRPVTTWTGREDGTTVARIWSQPGMRPRSYASTAMRSGTLELPAPLMPDGDMVPQRGTLTTIDGPGVVTALTVRPLFPLTAFELNHLWLRAYWDGESAPSIDAPLGSFFGSGLGEADVRAVPLGMSPSGQYYCFLPMPFWTSARFEIVNETPRPMPKLRWTIDVTPPGELGYARERVGAFKARYHREWPTREGRDYTLLDTTGRGVYVGQVMTVEPLRPEVKRWWEGDLRMYVDGRRHPALQGTGHEDEYLGGWSNEWLMNPYSLPMHGEPKTTDLTQVDFQWSAATTVYRFFATGVPYASKLLVSTEHGVDNGVPAMYSSVAYYYERPETMTMADALEIGDASDEARHHYATTPAAPPRTMTSRFEAMHGASDMTDSGRDVTGRSRFTLSVPATSRALRLRRLFDQAQAQDADVFVDGRPAGRWYTAATNGTRRWADADFILPAAAAGRSSIEVEIRPLAGAAWSEFRYELWALP